MENATLEAALKIGVMILIAFISGNVAAASLLYLVIREIAKSPVLIAFLEKLAKSLDPQLAAALNLTGKVIEEATDDTPYADKNTPLIPQGVG